MRARKLQNNIIRDSGGWQSRQATTMLAHLERRHALTRPLVIPLGHDVRRVVWRFVWLGDMPHIEPFLPVSGLLR